MAKLSETVMVVKISRLLKDDEVLSDNADSAIFDQLGEVVEAMVNDPKVMVEITKVQD